MAVVSNVIRSANAGPFTPTEITLATSGDTLSYSPGQQQELHLFNTDVSDIVVTIDGSTGTTVVVPGAGGATLSVAAGLAITVTAGKFSVVQLDRISAYLQGTVSIAAATGAKVKAFIIQQ